MIQGVRDIFDIVEQTSASSQEASVNKARPGGKIVLIGKGLRGGRLQESLANALG